MRIAFNPKSVAPLTAAPTGKYLNAITFDLAGHNIFTRGEMFKGTDTTYEVFRKATQSAVGYNGLVPAPSYNSGSIVRFLREDGNWLIPNQRPISIGGETILNLQDIDKSLDINSGNGIRIEAETDNNGNYTGKITVNTTFEIDPGEFDGTLADAFTSVKVGAAILKASVNKQLSLNAGTGITLSPNTTLNTIQIAAPIFTGATNSAAGKEGIVPAPTTSNTISYLRGDGNWVNLTTDQIIGLTDYVYNYTITSTPVNLATTDTLNQALAKLEHKANQGVYAYNWVISVTTEDTDAYINKWQEIVDFLNKVDNTDGADITDEFVTRKTAQSVIGAKTFEAATIINNTLAVNNTLTVKGNTNPQANNTYTLGTTSLQWKNIYSVLGTFSGNVSSAGFIKSGSSNDYLLLGGGGHKPISDFLLKSEELINNVTTITKSLTVTQAWMDTGISGTNIPNNGTYIVQISVNGGGMTECLWSGVMSWYSGTCSDDDTDEILLHRSGKAYSKTLYLRTKMNSGSLSLQIAANENVGAQYSYTFKFKQIL